MQKIPYMLTLGDKERDNQTVSIRLRNGKVFDAIPFKEFTDKLVNEIRERRLESLFLSSGLNGNQEVNNSSI
jgi:threonyl-tRNA synthetase